MYIKNIYNIQNYKGIPDGFRADFDDITYIIGDNAKNKTTIGSIPLWILTGYNLYGGNKEQVSNDNANSNFNTYASMTIIDNNGTEHTITRCKGKKNYVILDDIKTTQEMLTRYYLDVHAFICAYNPSYFRSMKLTEQRELLLRILPAISSEEAFELLDKSEKEILQTPVVDVNGYCKTKKAEIKELKSHLDRLSGSKAIYINMAIEKEDTLKEFNKQQELNILETEYERLITNTDNLLSLEDLEKDIKKLEDRINKNVKIDLQEYQSKQAKEIENLNNVSLNTSTCPTCKQEIKNESLIKALTITYKKNINNLAKNIENLKTETKELLDKKKLQVEKYKMMKTPEMQEQAVRRNEIKEKIDVLLKEKSDIDLYNREISIKQEQIKNAKQQIENITKETEEILEKIELFNNQIKVANRLNLLMIQEQMKRVNEYLDKVTIEFSKIDEETGEIIDAYIIKYNGRDYEKLSKSYKLRADIEIAKLINMVTGINTPMFIDDVESITQIDMNSNIQTILSIVVKYNDLEFLYSYSDVLIRERESINKKIAESSNLIQSAA